MRGSLQAYKKVSVDSQLTAASPHKIVQMLMAGAIERLIHNPLMMLLILSAKLRALGTKFRMNITT